jgi:hypothetical protein
MKNVYTPLKAAFFTLFIALCLFSVVGNAQTPDLLIKATSATSAGMSQALSTAVDASGNVYTTGDFTGTVAFGSTTLVSTVNFRDVFLAKYNSTGTLQWVKRVSGTGGTGGSRSAQGIAVSGSDVYITGAFTGTANFNTPSASSNEITTVGSVNIFLAKYSDIGTFQWAKRAGGIGSSGGISQGNGIAVSGSDVYITGYFDGTVNFNTPSATGSNEITSAGNFDIFLAKYNDTGTFQWAKRAGGTSNDFAQGIAVSGSDVYITGSFSGTANFNTPSATSNEITSADRSDIFLAKYNSTGTFQWAKRAGGTRDDNAYGIAVSGSDVYVTGSFGGTANFNTPSATGSNEITSAGSTDIFLAKYNNTGTFQWAKRAGRTNNNDFDYDYAFGVAVSNSDVFITGYFAGTVNFNTPSATGSNEITSAGGTDILLAKYNDTGTFQWAKRAGGTGNDEAKVIVVSGNAVYVAGNFKSTANFNTPSATGSNELTTVATNGDAFVARYGAVVCDCDPTCSPIPTAAGTYTATRSKVDGLYTHYCDGNNLLLSVLTPTNSTAIPPAAVQVKIGATAATFYPKWCGGTTAADKCFMVKTPATGGNVLINRFWHIDAAQVTGTAVSGSNQLQIFTYFTDTEFTALQTQMSTNSVVPALTSATGLILYQPAGSSALEKFADPALVKPLTFTKVINGTPIGINLWQHSTQTGGINQATFKISSIVNSGGIGKF